MNMVYKIILKGNEKLCSNIKSILRFRVLLRNVLLYSIKLNIFDPVTCIILPKQGNQWKIEISLVVFPNLHKIRSKKSSYNYWENDSIQAFMGLLASCCAAARCRNWRGLNEVSKAKLLSVRVDRIYVHLILLKFK